VDMGDGWETKRSRGGDHTDWVIVKLGAPGIIDKAVVDTAHFKGNFPKMIKLEATNSKEVSPAHNTDDSLFRLRHGQRY
jgi:allantoicase